MKNGRRLGAPPKPYTPPATPASKINLTDLDSRNVKTRAGWMQGYNAQAAVTTGQIVIAAEISVNSPDFALLRSVLDAALSELAAVGVTDTPAVLVADAGYWHQVQMQPIVDSGIAVLVSPDAGKRQGARPGWDGGRYAFMRRVLDTKLGGDLSTAIHTWGACLIAVSLSAIHGSPQSWPWAASEIAWISCACSTTCPKH